MAASVTPPEGALRAGPRGRIRTFKDSAPPRILPLELAQIAFFIDNRPANRTGTNIQAEDIVFRILQVHLDSPSQVRYAYRVALTQSDAASQNKGFASSAAQAAPFRWEPEPRKGFFYFNTRTSAHP